MSHYQLVHIEMANVAEWMRQNRLSLSANKSEFMVISHNGEARGHACHALHD